ncbi:MAG: AAA family ATPase, partial [Varibaculum cambriense]|nr:AAA family ATPase [Varibaculum cambriense]
MIVSIFNQKGGVGKTTSVVNLSVALVKEGKKVLVIDMDPQANTTTGLG